MPWWQQRVYEDYLIAQNEAQQQQQSGYAPDPPSGDATGTLDPFAPALLMQQAGFNVEIARPSNPE